VPDPDVTVPDVDATRAGDFEFSPILVEISFIDWSAVHAMKTCECPSPRQRGMIQHPVQQRDAIPEIGLEQLEERAAVPRSERGGAEAATLVASNSVFVKPRAIIFFVEVVSLRQLCEESTAIGCKRTIGEDLL